MQAFCCRLNEAAYTDLKLSGSDPSKGTISSSSCIVVSCS